MQVIETGSVAAASFAVTRAIRASPLQVWHACFNELASVKQGYAMSIKV